MGRIVAQVKVSNVASPTNAIEISALVDTGAAYLTLPSAWKARLGNLEVISVLDAELANQTTVKCEICGPVRLQLEGFRQVFGEVLFMEMTPDADGGYEALVGYLPLEQSQAAVDMLGHRLVRIAKVDVK